MGYVREIEGYQLTPDELDREVRRMRALLEDEARLDALAGGPGAGARIRAAKAGVLSSLGLDPRRSALFPRFGSLLYSACDPRFPLAYDPPTRAFHVVSLIGESLRRLVWCPFTGRMLPADLEEEWTRIVRVNLGLDDEEDFDPAAIAGRLGVDVASETWWLRAGLAEPWMTTDDA